MQAKPSIEFVLKEQIIEGVEITPSTIGLPRFNEFNQQVQDFLSGTEHLDVSDVHVGIAQGSYKLVAYPPPSVMSAIEPDLRSLQEEDSLGSIDPKRSEIISRWQSRSKHQQKLNYAIAPNGINLKPIIISQKSDYRVGDVIPWIRVEKYLFGIVMDIGGAHKANVHIRLRESGNIVRVSAEQSYLMMLEGNHLYRDALLRVEAEQHLKTGQLRNLRLISLEDHNPTFNESDLKHFIAAGTRAWADVPNASAWVRELRGGAS